MAAGGWAQGCLFVWVFARACPELVEVAGSDAADAALVRSAQTPLRMRSWRPPFARNAKDGAPHCVGDAREIKAWARAGAEGS